MQVMLNRHSGSHVGSACILGSPGVSGSGLGACLRDNRKIMP